MAQRGRGALLTREAREQAAKSKRKLPWKKKGLTRVQRVVAFLEFLPVTKGILVGKEDEAAARPARLHSGGLRSDEERRPALDKLGDQVGPEGQWKTGLCAGIALCHLLGPEAEQRGEVYSASIDGSPVQLVSNDAINLPVLEYAPLSHAVQ